jgi:hypothetical protein
VYGADAAGALGRYSPPAVTGCEFHPINGEPDRKHISTSYVERSNLTVRMGMRRFTRLTNGFSKKAESRAHMVALFFTYSNFCRIHQTLRITPAMAAKLTAEVCSIEDIVYLLD